MTETSPPPPPPTKHKPRRTSALGALGTLHPASGPRILLKATPHTVLGMGDTAVKDTGEVPALLVGEDRQIEKEFRVQ